MLRKVDAMRKMGVWSFFRMTLGMAALAVASLLVAEEKPDWEVTVADDNLAAFEGIALHPKENAWLLTCRMKVSSSSIVSPVSQIELKGVDKEEEVVWEKSHTIRRRDFEGAFGGGQSQFVRIFIRDVPVEVVEVRLHYGSKDEE